MWAPGRAGVEGRLEGAAWYPPAGTLRAPPRQTVGQVNQGKEPSMDRWRRILLMALATFACGALLGGGMAQVAAAAEGEHPLVAEAEDGNKERLDEAREKNKEQTETTGERNHERSGIPI